MKILIINGPNLNFLGKRDESKYGNFTLSDLENLVVNEFPDDQFEFFQSNIEGEIVGKIQNAIGAYEAIVINPGGYAHTSVAIRDALELFKGIKVEVHLSHLANREEFRQTLITATAADGYISGFKEKGYLSAVYLVKKLMSD